MISITPNKIIDMDVHSPLTFPPDVGTYLYPDAWSPGLDFKVWRPPGRRGLYIWQICWVGWLYLNRDGAWSFKY